MGIVSTDAGVIVLTGTGNDNTVLPGPAVHIIARLAATRR
ncbi:Uncharacterised protein [Mobiluncus curtisii]|uniref:Uncharacterized protein n=1 Tax=Mobiluncus curtisii TaxID=2051 RepID=A0A2X2YRH4_9ACTO|nr:Uncharacterised protein [Mobiluncus curtisii]STY89876.1 Uncharacterised protein [Mobiluncus holmesii]